MKNIRFLSENVQFLEVKFSIYLNRRDFVMVPRKYHNHEAQLFQSTKRMGDEEQIRIEQTSQRNRRHTHIKMKNCSRGTALEPDFFLHNTGKIVEVNNY